MKPISKNSQRAFVNFELINELIANRVCSRIELHYRIYFVNNSPLCWFDVRGALL